MPHPAGTECIRGKKHSGCACPAKEPSTPFTVCRYGSEEFLPETPFVLVLVEFDDADTLFLGRLLGVDPDAAGLDWIGMKVRAKYLRNSKLKPTDVYFVPLDEAHEQVETRP